MKALYSIANQLNWKHETVVDCPKGYVRVQIAAAGLNRADLLQRQGKYPPPKGITEALGLECAGIITETNQVTNWQVGDRVCALLAGGAMATEVVIDARHLLPVPQNLSLVEAAVLPEVYATAWLNLFQIAQLKPSEKVLIHAGAGGVGSAAIQLCKAFNNPCWVTVGSQDRLDYCKSLGAEGGVIRTENLEAINKQAPFDVILDPVGANYTALNTDLLNIDGRWVIIAMMGGHKTEINLAKLLAKRIQMTGSTLRSRNDDFKAALIKQLTEKVWPLFETNQLSHNLAKTFAIEQADQAFEALASNQINGKIALTIN
ncbi:NAD(P)H-quinone oxidoreductase [Entomomonas asaccharolytica]|uniref:NAD(P)H-quinone oxidoreductase n=1 Tax=Entomomonas asaccharolytica TaxID=2785331 RepID=A0A974RVS1_9GAMM|nr:NAD(P)H-quinone oxidoreductase [Entomomonas asaccharolytica]QQP84395.1 NAD(P)H-quinone oxidoreductase [Entomomonas asaccharolytica]